MIFVATIVIWFLQTFDTRINVVADSADSMLAQIGRFISPVFSRPWAHRWRASTALITGFTAKEAVVSTLAVLTGTNMAGLPAALGGIFSPLAACSFLAFTVLYTPCVAAVNTAKGLAARSIPLGCFIPDRRCLDYGNLDLSGRLPDFRIKSRAAVGAAAAEGERG